MTGSIKLFQIAHLVGDTFHYQSSSVTIYQRAMHLPLPKIHWSASPVAGFLGMSDVHECPVGFKWLWWPFTSRHLAVNRHTTANWCYPLIWLLFVAFEAQMDHYWGHFGVSVTDVCLAHHFMAPHYPQPY